jgi:RNA polymerase sigma-70 factor (sigma-E family)
MRSLVVRSDQVELLRAAYERWYLSLLRLCVLLVGNVATAEDIVQETFVRAAPRLPELSEPSVLPYLRRSMANIWKNVLRHRSVELRSMPQLAREESTPFGEGIEERAAIWAAITRLPPRQRACVVLRYYEELTDREIADVLGCSVSTVKSQSHRALRKLSGEIAG